MHSNTKSEEYKRFYKVDAAGLHRRVFILPGEVSDVAQAATEKSAEVIVVGGNEPSARA